MSVRQLADRHKAPAGRRLHIVPSPNPRPQPMHAEERRMRDAGGPDDRACYSCGCGFVFVAPVSTSVQCPHCDTGQAW
ncbi:MAG: hypothetical protein ACLGI5_04620 [Thermoleophilia bacterium]